MSTVFYRKWRPNRFSDVVGQSHVTDTLRRAVMSDRVAHAYLFTGPRGVGKTSTARILAKALNSELDQYGDPLADTPTSIAIDEGRYMDLIEIDAASNRGIDDIRALRDRVLLRPVQGKFKVYIIDEVHMLTDAAFNALLKTLEEPPPQVVMILATTDIHRVPATIISRCQRFDFRRLTPDDVIGRLIEICDVEEIECQPEVLELVATSAWGSLRDAENLIEQLSISYGGGGAEITESQARELLGMGDASAANELATAILSQDAKKALEIVGAEASRGAELKGLRDSTVSAIRAALLMKHGVQNTYGEFGIDTDLGDAASKASVDQIMHAITVLGKNERFGEASSPLSLEVASLQAVASPQVQSPSQEKPQTYTPSPAPQQTQRPPTRASDPSTGQTSPQPSPQTAATSGSSDEDPKWSMLLSEIQAVTNRRIRTVFVQVTPDGPNNGVLVLRPKYENSTERLRNTWRDENVRNQLRQAFQKVYGQDIRIQLDKYQASSPPKKAPQSPATPSNNVPPPSPEHAASVQQHEAVDDTPAPVLQETSSTSLPPEIYNHPVLQTLRSSGARVTSLEDAPHQND